MRLKHHATLFFFACHRVGQPNLPTGKLATGNVINPDASKMTVTICPANPRHQPFLSTFGREAFIHSYRCTLPLEELESYTAEAFSAQTIARELDDPSIHFFIAEDENASPCGYAKLVESAPPDCIQSVAQIELQRLYVNLRIQAKGVGRLLADHFESFARARALDTLWLRVWDGNRGAIAIYQHWGYTVVGDAPYPVGNEQRTVLIMRKRL